ncbi:MAG: hypothetical protein DCC71_24545 [Proteobacteria bacterium]|nr:MAG: hypothetical protein DCC71_24545 [Pseudomonadota bacterium]
MLRLQRLRCASAAALAWLATAPAASAMPVISELFYDAVGSDDGWSFVELYGAPGASLDGLRLESVNGDGGAVAARLVLSGTFGADGLFVVADRTAAGATQVPDADLLLDFDFQNGPDSLVLLGASGVLDALAYGVFAPEQVAAGEGAPAPDVAPGESLARRFADVDGDDNALDFVVLAAPTPGTAPLAAIPEPGTAALAAFGLAALARRRNALR